MPLVLLLPVYRPTREIPRPFDGVTAPEFSCVIVVYDGSGAEYAPIFAAINRGKGMTLKTGME